MDEEAVGDDDHHVVPETGPLGEDEEPPQRFVMDTEMQPGDPEPARRFVEDTEELCPTEASQDESTEEGPLTIDTASQDSQDSEPLADTCLIIDGKVCVACILSVFGH